MYNPFSATYFEYYLDSLRTAARSLGVAAIPTPVRGASELESTIAVLAREPNGSLLVIPDSYMTSYRAEITSLAAADRLPVIYPFRFFAHGGGLMSYGNDGADSYRRAASYADRILKGEKPAELPVEPPTKFELVINLQDRQSPRPHDPADPPRPRRRGDRMSNCGGGSSGCGLAATRAVS